MPPVHALGGLSDLASLATVISGIAVLGSLLYLAQQTRQNTRHTRALIQQARNTSVVGFNIAIAADPALGETLRRGDACDSALTQAERFSYINYVGAQLSYAEDQFYQHKEGLVAEERHAGMVAYLQYARGPFPGFRAAWELWKPLYGAEFRAFADQTIRAAATLPANDAVSVWSALAVDELERAAPKT